MWHVVLLNGDKSQTMHGYNNIWKILVLAEAEMLGSTVHFTILNQLSYFSNRSPPIHNTNADTRTPTLSAFREIVSDFSIEIRIVLTTCIKIECVTRNCAFHVALEMKSVTRAYLNNQLMTFLVTDHLRQCIPPTHCVPNKESVEEISFDYSASL